MSTSADKRAGASLLATHAAEIGPAVGQITAWSRQSWECPAADRLDDEIEMTHRGLLSLGWLLNDVASELLRLAEEQDAAAAIASAAGTGISDAQ